MAEPACLMDCLRAGSNAARCKRTLGTGSAVRSRHTSRKYVLKNLHSKRHPGIVQRMQDA